MKLTDLTAGVGSLLLTQPFDPEDKYARIVFLLFLLLGFLLSFCVKLKKRMADMFSILCALSACFLGSGAPTTIQTFFMFTVAVAYKTTDPLEKMIRYILCDIMCLFLFVFLLFQENVVPDVMPNDLLAFNTLFTSILFFSGARWRFYPRTEKVLFLAIIAGVSLLRGSLNIRHIASGSALSRIIILACCSTRIGTLKSTHNFLQGNLQILVLGLLTGTAWYFRDNERWLMSASGIILFHSMIFKHFSKKGKK